MPSNLKEKLVTTVAIVGLSCISILVVAGTIYLGSELVAVAGTIMAATAAKKTAALITKVAALTLAGARVSHHIGING